MLKWLATFILIWFVYEVRHVFPPIIVGAIIAYLLLPLISTLRTKFKLPTGVATAIVYLALLVIIGLTIWWLGPPILKEVAELATRRHEIVENVVQQFANYTNSSFDVKASTDQIIHGLTGSIGNPAELAHLGGMVSHGFLAVLVCVVSSIYIAVDSSNIGRFFLRYLPEDRQPEAVQLAAQMNSLLSKYVRGQLMLIVLMGIVAYVFLGPILGMKFALPVAILSGFLEIIPVLGPILAISTATLVGIWQFGPNIALVIIIYYTIARWIEDYFVVPKFIGHAVDLHPLAVIFAVLSGERMAGALGMLIAIPVAACIKLFIDFFYFGKVPADPKHADLQQPLVEQDKEPPLAQEINLAEPEKGKSH